jgi:hypothetical protein
MHLQRCIFFLTIFRDASDSYMKLNPREHVHVIKADYAEITRESYWGAE